MGHIVSWTGRRIVPLFFGAVFLAIGLVLVWKVPVASAQTTDPCAKRNERLAKTGKGDRDFDGLSNCTEKFVTGTSRKDPDSDDDGVNDGDEITDGTDPLDADSDDDGLSDGDEAEFHTDPNDVDTDGDGVDDGDDVDPADALRTEIKGYVDAITCPDAISDGSITVADVAATLTTDTEYDGAESCDDLAARFVANGGAHVEVTLEGSADTGFVADEVELDDADNDGSPDLVDSDDDNDGTPDDEDADDDGDGVPDESDDDHPLQ